ncbi:MAG: CHRD domain-containing protein [Acidimicrobiia bacterium]|nr:CHRD domain-containing protein [Acidimicrobiia bacterium]
MTVGMLFALVPAAAAAAPAHAGRPEMTPPAHAGRPLSAMLKATNEVSPGPLNGTGTANLWLNQGQGRICFSLTWSNQVANPTAAHIHKAPAGQNGGVVVPLFLTTKTTSPASGCVSVSDKDLIKDIRQNPHNYYVNVHNAAFLAGAIRGQLSK